MNAPVCAVGDDVTTMAPTAVEHAEVPAAALVTDVPTSGRRAIGPADAEPARVPVPVEDVASQALVRPGGTTCTPRSACRATCSPAASC